MTNVAQFTKYQPEERSLGAQLVDHLPYPLLQKFDFLVCKTTLAKCRSHAEIFPKTNKGGRPCLSLEDQKEIEDFFYEHSVPSPHRIAKVKTKNSGKTVFKRHFDTNGKGTYVAHRKKAKTKVNINTFRKYTPSEITDKPKTSTDI